MNNPEINELVQRMINVAPKTFKDIKEQGQINNKIKEVVSQLDSTIKSLGYIKHGTPGGRKKYAKDLGVTLLSLFELLPLVEHYGLVDTFTETIKKRLFYKEAKENIVYLAFGKVNYGYSYTYAALIKYDSGNSFIVYLSDDSYSINSDEQVVKTFKQVKVNACHNRINTRFDWVKCAIEKGCLKVNVVTNKLELFELKG
jgi:hypothetical protein